jgi:hypothetical protein
MSIHERTLKRAYLMYVSGKGNDDYDRYYQAYQIEEKINQKKCESLCPLCHGEFDKENDTDYIDTNCTCVDSIYHKPCFEEFYQSHNNNNNNLFRFECPNCRKQNSIYISIINDFKPLVNINVNTNTNTYQGQTAPISYSHHYDDDYLHLMENYNGGLYSDDNVYYDINYYKS